MYFRGDTAVLRPTWFAKVTGLPATLVAAEDGNAPRDGVPLERAIAARIGGCRVALHVEGQAARAWVNWPGNWHTVTPAAGRWCRGHTGDPWGTLDESGTDVSPMQAESIAAVGAAICAISTTLAALPVAVVEANEQRNEVPRHDLTRLIRDGANPNETFPEFVETLVSTCLLNGNSTAQIVTDARGRLTALKTLPWVNMTVRATDDDELLFDYRRPRPAGNTPQLQTFAREDLLLLRDRSDDGLLGRPRLQRASAAMAYAISIRVRRRRFPPTYRGPAAY